MTTARARELRQTMTVQERRLDFVCFDRRLVVELDGGQHNDDRRIEHDAVRDAILRREGFTVLRFWNGAVNADIGAVMDRIVRTLEDAPSKHADWERPARSCAQPDTSLTF